MTDTIMAQDNNVSLKTKNNLLIYWFYISSLFNSSLSLSQINITKCILIIVIVQTWKPSSLLLVHLGLSNSVLTLAFLLLSTATIISGQPVAGLQVCYHNNNSNSNNNNIVVDVSAARVPGSPDQPPDCVDPGRHPPGQVPGHLTPPQVETLQRPTMGLLQILLSAKQTYIS